MSTESTLTKAPEGTEILAERYQIAHLDAVPSTRCPCGESRRAFMNDENTVASMHLVDIHRDSRTHYHRRMTEIYLVLEGEGTIELDGVSHPLRPLTSVLIKPGCRHRAVGEGLRIINVPIPKFDPEDEWFDE